MKKPWPVPESDEDAGRFVAEAALARRVFAAMVPAGRDKRPKTATVGMRVPQPLIEPRKADAAPVGVPYPRLIRQAVGRALGEKRR